MMRMWVDALLVITLSRRCSLAPCDMAAKNFVRVGGTRLFRSNVKKEEMDTVHRINTMRGHGLPL
jgi:hypothetical protein